MGGSFVAGAKRRRPGLEPVEGRSRKERGKLEKGPRMREGRAGVSLKLR